MVYDCSSFGMQRQPFAVWMLDSVGSLGVKRLKPHLSHHIGGVLGFCRKVFKEQVPFDDEFRIDDSKLYCVELTEKAFRSQGLALSKPVCFGDWENLVQYPVTAFGILRCSGLVLEHAITLDQPVYLPGNDRLGMWSSPLLETVYPRPKQGKKTSQPSPPPGLSVKGDMAVTAFAVKEINRSYSELPWRLIGDLLMKSAARESGPRLASTRAGWSSMASRLFAAVFGSGDRVVPGKQHAEEAGPVRSLAGQVAEGELAAGRLEIRHLAGLADAADIYQIGRRRQELAGDGDRQGMPANPEPLGDRRVAIADVGAEDPDPLQVDQREP